MAINFPDSPVDDDIITRNGRSWKFNGGGWEAYAGETLLGPQGPQGERGIKGDPGDQGLVPFTLDDVKMVNFESNTALVKGYLESGDILTQHRGALPISFDSDVKFVELKYTSSIVLESGQAAQFAEDSVNGTVYIDWENKRLKQSSLRKEGDANHYQHWYESTVAESDGIIMFNTPDPTPANSAEGIIINWSNRQITGLPAYNRTYSNDVPDTAPRSYEHQYIFKDLTRGGTGGITGVIQETQAWENADYDLNVDYTNDTGAPLDIRLYVQNDNSDPVENSDISINVVFISDSYPNGTLFVPFVDTFKLSGAGAHDDVGNITIPTGATFKFVGGTGGGDPNLIWKRMVRTQIIVERQTPSVTGTATFTASTNNIALADIHNLTGLAVGDVIEVTGSVSGNDGVYTAESIALGNVIVNAAHAGGTSLNIKALTDEIETVTVTLVAKANIAALGYGQGWVNFELGAAENPGRWKGITYTNSTGRSIEVSVRPGVVNDGADADIAMRFEVDGLVVGHWQRRSTGTTFGSCTFTVPPGSTYSMDTDQTSQTPSPASWRELR